MEWQCWHAQTCPESMGLIIGHRFLLFTKTGIMAAIVGRGFDNLKEFHQRVLEAEESGADFIKIMTTGLLDFKNHGEDDRRTAGGQKK